MQRAAIIAALSAYRIVRGSGVSEPLRAVDVQGIADAVLEAAQAEALVSREVLESHGDISSLISARCAALPGDLIPCPVCKAVDDVRRAEALEEGVATDPDMKTALELLDRWDATRSEVSGKGTVETMTRDFIAKMEGLKK